VFHAGDFNLAGVGSATCAHPVSFTIGAPIQSDCTHGTLLSGGHIFPAEIAFHVEHVPSQDICASNGVCIALAGQLGPA
jgi:hypothetical protein